MAPWRYSDVFIVNYCFDVSIAGFEQVILTGLFLLNELWYTSIFANKQLSAAIKPPKN